MKNDIEDKWIIGEGQHEGWRLMMRQNIGVRPIVGNVRFPFRVGIAVPFKSPKKDGMPNEDEAQPLNRIEDTIYDYFDAKGKGVTCLIFTTQGMREFIIYSTIDNVAELVELLKTDFPTYEIQHYVEQDKEWDVYKQWSASP